MSERSAAMGFASASAGSPPPKSSACFFEMNDQVTASTNPLAASARLAARVRLCKAVSTGRRALAPRSNGVGGTRSRPRMRTISSTRSALPSTSPRQLGAATFTVSPEPATMKPSAVEHALDLAHLGLQPREPARLGEREIDHAAAVGNGAREHDLGGLAAAELQHELGGELQPRHGKGGIDAALEAETRIGNDPELAPGLRDIGRVPQRRFDQHVGRRFRAAARFAAHDAGERFDAQPRRRSRTYRHRARRCGRRGRATSRRSVRAAPRDCP